jgi:hypothetical protein
MAKRSTAITFAPMVSPLIGSSHARVVPNPTWKHYGYMSTSLRRAELIGFHSSNDKNPPFSRKDSLGSTYLLPTKACRL